jgi:hypothetical protein
VSTGARLLTVLLTFGALCLGLAACGGNSGPDTTAEGTNSVSAREASATHAMAKAEANCRKMLAEVKAAAHGVLSEGFKNNLQLVTLGFGRPGLAIAKRMRARQAKLIGAIDSPAYETYVGLFDPIILYAQKNVRAAEAEDLARATELKEKLTTLGTEQRIVAGEAGLPACEVDFLEAMVRAASP